MIKPNIFVWVFQMKVNKTIIYCAVAFSWALGILFDFAWKIFTSDIVGHTCNPLNEWPSPEIHQAVGIIIFLVQYLIPLLAMVVCYGRIFYVLRNKVRLLLTGILYMLRDLPCLCNQRQCSANIVHLATGQNKCLFLAKVSHLFTF
jgi:hypothetical protein